MNGPVSFGDRILSAMLSAAFIAITLLISQVGIAYIGKVVAIKEMVENYEIIYKSSLVLIMLVGATGFTLGTERMLSFFGHLWCTEQPKNILITSILWCVLLGFIVIPVIVSKN